jgi:hypothetical protein
MTAKEDKKSYIIVLTSDKDFQPDFSFEAGKHDGKKHFDHHGKFSDNSPVCIQPIWENTMSNHVGYSSENPAIIQINHFCPDIYIALKQFLQITQDFSFFKNVPDAMLFFNNVAKIDLGENINMDNRAHQFCAGLKTFHTDIPRCTEKHQDITKLINLELPVDEIIEAGREVIKRNEEVYKRSFHGSQDHFNNTGLTTTLFRVADKDTEFFNPLFPYYGTEETNSVIVIYREKYKSISIGIDPRLRLNFQTFKNLGDVEEEVENPAYQITIEGIRFFGHDTVAGTERRQEGWTFEDAKKIYTELYYKL